MTKKITVKVWASRRHTRRSAVLLWTAVSATALMGFAALAVDVGYQELIGVELQTAADASAMAGVSAFASATQFNKTFNPCSLAQLAVDRAVAYGAKNVAEGKGLTISTGDVVVGFLAHPEIPTDTISASTYPYNAVRVSVYKQAGLNGPVGTFFGNIWGVKSVNAAATATAVLDNQLAGYKPGPNGGPLIPITIDQATWTNLITNGNGADVYALDYQTGKITNAFDGIPEINIYPDKQNNNSTGAGNFGLLNFENGNNSTNPVGDQIQYGLTTAEVQRTIGSDTFTFYKNVTLPNNTVTGTPITYAIDGTPGLKASLESAFTSRVGSTVGIFINDQVAGSGSNCVYTITGIQYGVLLAADLSGGNAAVIIQPTVYVGPENITAAGAPRSATGGRIKLAR